MPLLQLSLELPLQMLQPKKFPSVAAAAAAATAAAAAAAAGAAWAAAAAAAELARARRQAVPLSNREPQLTVRILLACPVAAVQQYCLFALAASSLAAAAATAAGGSTSAASRAVSSLCKSYWGVRTAQLPQRRFLSSLLIHI